MSKNMNHYGTVDDTLCSIKLCSAYNIAINPIVLIVFQQCCQLLKKNQWNLCGDLDHVVMFTKTQYCCIITKTMYELSSFLSLVSVASWNMYLFKNTTWSWQLFQLYLCFVFTTLKWIPRNVFIFLPTSAVLSAYKIVRFHWIMAWWITFDTNAKFSEHLNLFASGILSQFWLYLSSAAKYQNNVVSSLQISKEYLYIEYVFQFCSNFFVPIFMSTGVLKRSIQ